MSKIPVTVIVPVKNEELNLPHCLHWLGDFAQVIVVDSASTDRTPQIAREWGAEVVDFRWNGRFPKKRNWALRNLEIKNDWVLFLDADEYLSEPFLKELRVCIADPAYDGYWVRYTVHLLGRQLHFGDPMHKLPLFRVGKGEYEFIDERQWSPLDMEVHEHPIIDGRTSLMKRPIIHNDFKTLEHYRARHRAYADWEAHRYMDICSTGRKDILTRRQRIKYLFLDLRIAGYAYFLESYFLRLGFLDGKCGFLYAWYKAGYFNRIQRNIKQIRKEEA